MIARNAVRPGARPLVLDRLLEDPIQEAAGERDDFAPLHGLLAALASPYAPRRY